MITTNHLKRNTENLIDFSTDLREFVLHNCKYLAPIKHSNCRLFSLIMQAIDNGLFMRNTNNKKSFNYWQPLSNAGLPAVPRDDFIHELAFFSHDVLHNLIPDLQISDCTSLHKKVYVIYRLIGEGICLVLADMYCMDELKKQGIDYDFEKKKIYQGFYPMREKDFKSNIKGNAIFAATGSLSFYDADIREDEGFMKYVDWFSPVYISDIKWSLHNANCQLNLSQATFAWQSDIKKYLPKVICTSNEVILPTTAQLIETLNLTKDMSEVEMADCIFEWIYREFYMVESYTESPADKARERFYAFQSKIAYDYKLDISAYLNCLASKDYNAFNNLYKEDLKYLFSKRILTETQFDIYKEVYPHFDSCFISYSASKVEDISLEEYAKYLYSVM